MPAGREPGLLPQDPGVQLLQLRPGLDSELRDEGGARVAECLERLRLSAAAVKREHAERADPLAQRRRCGEGLELSDHLPVEAELDVGRDALLERVEPQLLQATDLALGELLARQIRERGAAPEGEGRAEELCALGGGHVARLRYEGLEPDRVDRGGICREDVSGRARIDDVRAERAPEL